MIMADKIVELRKKNGWSQEELAEKLNVTRQSVSKWEGAQSTPDLSKVVQMAELFGVSTDYLLREEREEAEYVAESWEESRGEIPLRRVSMEEAHGFLMVSAENARRVSRGVMLCILSPIVMILLSCGAAEGRLPFTEDQGGIFGLVILLLILAGAVALFVRSGAAGAAWEYIEKEPLETAYGVDGMVRERRRAYEATHSREMTLGVALCVLAMIPALLGYLLMGDRDLATGVGFSGTLAVLAVGVQRIVLCSMIWDGYAALLEEGDYTRERKAMQRSPLMKIYWAVVLAGYLAYSFLTNDWRRSWIIWPVAGVLSAGLSELAGRRR